MDSRTALILLSALLTVFAAGCATPPADPSGPAATPTVADPAAATPAGTMAATSHAVPIDVIVRQYGSPMVVTSCDVTVPDECDRVPFSGVLYFEGSWNGTAPYVTYISFFPDTMQSGFQYDSIQFSGSMAGCGNGTLVMNGWDRIQNEPSPEGAHVIGSFDLIPGTATGGLSTVADLHVPFDFHFLPDHGFKFHFVGTMQCA